MYKKERPSARYRTKNHTTPKVIMGFVRTSPIGEKFTSHFSRILVKSRRNTGGFSGDLLQVVAHHDPSGRRGLGVLGLSAVRTILHFAIGEELKLVIQNQVGGLRGVDVDRAL